MSLGLGIDVGAGSVTAAVVRRRGGSLFLEHYVHCPLDELEAEGVDVTAPRAVARAVAGRFAERGMRLKGGVLGISGRDAIIRYSHMPPMPAWRLALLVEFEVNEVAEKTGEALSSDFRVLRGGADGSHVLVALAKDARVEEAVGALEGVGFEVSGALPQPVAVGDAYRFLGEDAELGTALVVDIGRASTEVAIVEQGDLLFARSVAQGGEVFAERLVQLLDVDRATAEEVLHSGRTPDGDDIDELLGPARQRLASMVAASLDFAQKQLKMGRIAVDRVVVTGGAARVPGLVEAVGAAVGCPAELFDPFAHIETRHADHASRDEAQRYGCEGTTAVGLALSRVLPRATELNLLPLALKERLRFRHRTAWLYASAAVVGAAVFVALGFALWSRSGERDRAAQLQQALGAVQAREAAHADLESVSDSRHEELRSLARRTRPGFHLAALLQRVGEVLPREITLTRLELARDGEDVLRFELAGQADDAQRRGVDAMRALELSLAEDPRVASAKIEDVETGGAVLRFRLTVVPVGNPSPQAPDEEGS